MKRFAFGVCTTKVKTGGFLTVSVLERGPWPGWYGRSLSRSLTRPERHPPAPLHHHATTPQITTLSSVGGSTHSLALCSLEALSLLLNLAQFLSPLFPLVLDRVGDGVGFLQVVDQRGLVPEGLKAQATSQTVVFVI